MGRKQTYFCDTCEKVFGDKPHINLEGLMLRVAYKQGTNWKTKRFSPARYNQFHFCNALCLNEWLSTHIEEIFRQIEGGQNAIPTN